MPVSRKAFLSATAIGVAAAASTDAASAAAGDASAAPARAPVHYPLLRPGQYDRAAMLQKIETANPHKQVFQSVSPIVIAPGIASVYIHMQNAMNAYEFSLGLGKLATLAVFIGPSIALALNDDMWSKYSLGTALSGPGAELAHTNVYYKAASADPDFKVSPNDPNGIYQDWSGQAVLARGGHFFVCHNATTAIAYLIGSKAGVDGKTVLGDFEKNLLPGFQMVPAGVAAVQQAQEHGWKLYPII